jgi:hypothetical protein
MIQGKAVGKDNKYKVGKKENGSTKKWQQRQDKEETVG